MGKWKTVIAVLLSALFLAGLFILLYPRLRGAVTSQRITQEAHAFLQNLENAAAEAEDAPRDGGVSKEHEALWNAMTAYNEKIWTEKQAGLCDPWAYEQPSFTLGDYGLEDEVFGVVSIPRLGLEMPIYLGAAYQHMEAGAAHLSQTSLPIGGNNTNSVIVGHCGWRGAPYFRYITELEAGDEVAITNLWDTLTYTVSETKIIAPNDVAEILIQENRELLTLLTCYPYASGGKQRYVVYCERVQNEMEVT